MAMKKVKIKEGEEVEVSDDMYALYRILEKLIRENRL